MAQGGLKAATTVVGPFEEGTVDRCLVRLKHHCIIALFSSSLSIPGLSLGDAVGIIACCSRYIPVYPA